MYDFTSLSAIDFEFLTRDLLQKELNITLESFTSGRDDGIDLRYSNDSDGMLVVQCKHYAASRYADLKSRLKKELSSIKDLAPSRYIVATSIGLTPGNKKELFDLLTPYCRSENDIYGREDLNNLLTKFPEVERTHFKLWLTGSAVLEKILHSAVFNQTDFEIAAIEKKLKLYVQNESYNEALKILESDHYCIIAGIPGIGKTTLAEVLLVHYINLGYKAFAIGSDIKDAIGVYRSEKKQVFFYDDFLGQTSFEEKFNKNEEQKLLRFIETIRNSKNARFILTTREYILNQAKTAYEKLDRSRVDINKCVISLDKYTTYDKARILYNHLYFSNLSEEYKRELVTNQHYRKIIEHGNYSPRVIEWMTEKGKDLEISAGDYFEHFIANLNNPIRLWEHAFDYQLADSTQHLMLVLGTMPAEVLLDDLEAAFALFYEYSAKKQNFRMRKNDFLRALKEAESNFVHTEKKSDSIIARFHNPSIRDFIENRLASDLKTLKELCVCAVFYEQVIKLWNLSIRENKENNGDSGKTIFEEKPDELLKRLGETIKEKGCEFQTFTGGNNRLIVHRKFSFENRLLSATRIAQRIFGANMNGVVGFLEPLYKLEQKRLEEERGNKEDLISLLSAIKKSDLGKRLLKGGFLAAAKEFFLADFYTTDDFKYFLEFKDGFNGLIDRKDLESVTEDFVDFAKDEIESFLADYNPDPGIADWWIDELTILSIDFGIEIDDDIQKLKDFLIEIDDEKEVEDENPPVAGEPNDESSTYTDDDIRDMFESLIDK